MESACLAEAVAEIRNVRRKLLVLAGYLLTKRIV